MVQNLKQDDVINNTGGIYVVDAGPGTGKTYTITKRYLKILGQPNIYPKDILLLTFTKNAAENMKEKILNKLIESNPDINVMDARISTFHAFCKQILSQGCEDAPKYLGINERLNRNFSLVENGMLEKNFFKRVYNSFKKSHPKYEVEYKIIGGRYLEIFSLIKKLSSKGVFPENKGWFLEGEDILKGDQAIYTKIVDKLNLQGEGSKGSTQSKLLKRFKPKINAKLYFDIPEHIEADKQVNPHHLAQAFEEDRGRWIDFAHDIYHYYIIRSVKENRLTFDFLIMFTFLELYHNKTTRDNNSFQYLMIDEFQDTNEIQFMLSLLLMKADNLCVVGDWKQGIYGFRNATIENILQFQDKIKHYKELLNRTEERILFQVESEKKEFELNFRSSQKILDFSINSLYVKGAVNENMDTRALGQNITELTANFNLNDSSDIRFYQTKDKEMEVRFILSKIQKLVNNSNLTIVEGVNKRSISYKDIAVLSRTRTFGLYLQELGIKYGIPINYDGGIELFKTKESVLLLAILRILANKNDKKGWITILDYYNYSLGDKRQIIKSKNYPGGIIDLRNSIFRYKKNVVFLLTKIFEHFNMDSIYSNAIIKELGNLFSNNLMSIENLIYFIEGNIESGETYNIDINTSEDAVTVQTIHGAKGLEYPVVIIANCNEKQFPSANSDNGILSWDGICGLRCSKIYQEKNGYHVIFDNWRSDMVKSAVLTNYDEERRLLFVAMTRAKQYVFLTASKPSMFFKDLADKDKVEKIEGCEVEQQEMLICSENGTIDIPLYEKTGNIYPVHDFIQYTPDEKGRGKEFGSKIHNISEQLALGKEVKDDSDECLRIKEFIQNLKAKELKPEIECALPVGDDLVRGIIDLVVIYDDRIEVIDYKTDVSKLNHGEYVKQMSFYYHTVSEFYNKPVICKIFYVSQNEIVEIEPLSIEKISELMRNTFLKK